MSSLNSRGKAIINLLPLDKNEKISTILPLSRGVSEDLNIIFSTSSGMVRRNKLKDFINIQSNGKIAIKLEGDEQLIGVSICDDNKDILLATHLGKCVRFPISDLRVFSGRNSRGVTGIKLIGDDTVISMILINHDSASYLEREELLNKIKSNNISSDEMEEIRSKADILLTVTENGYGKRTSSLEYRTTSRGGVGIKNIEKTDKTGNVIATCKVKEDEDIVLITDQGQMIRISASDIRITSRVTQGVILFRIADNAKVVSAVPLQSEDKEPILENQGDSRENQD